MLSERGVVGYCELLCFAITILPALPAVAIITIIVIVTEKEHLGSVGNTAEII